MRYLLDTDTISATLKAAPPASLIQRLAATDPRALCTSAITVGEMVYGALRSSRADDLIARFESQVWPILSVVPFGFGEAQVYGRLRSLMERAGTP
ncbi:MAG: type II toxin-antitoxin system VapC family toxin, partial [Armatimonadetes bacterium]|nr:type II toxin-antitoxin system VapC family toxin [Armatimonadota bacterium]